MTSKLFAFAALVFLSIGCSGEQQIGQDSECVEDADCPAGFTCEEGLCEGASAVTTDAGPDDPGRNDGGSRVRAAGEAVGGPPGVVIDVETEDCVRGPACEVKPGSDVTFYAPSLNGYRFVRWTGGDRCVGTESTLKIENITVSTVCTAKYVKRVLVRGESGGLSADLTASSNGVMADCSGASSCVVDAGSTVVISASQVSGYRFTGFVGEACSDTEGLSVYVKADESDVTCTATYVRSFEVAGLAVGANTIIGAQSDTAFADCTTGRCVIDEQGEVTLTAPVLQGYRFAGWSGDSACVGNESSLRIVPVSADVNCAANYVARFTATGLAAGSVSNPSPLASSSAEFATCMEGVCSVDQGSDVVLSARTIPGYRLTGFSGVGCDDVSGAAVTLSNLAANIVCTAQYVQGISISGNVVGATGEVSARSSSPGNNCAAGACVVDAGGSVTLTAPAPAGFRFTGWTGDAGCSGAGQSITLSNVSVSATCSANFVARTSVSFADPVGGSIRASNVPATATCGAASCFLDSGSTVTLTASADPGFRFVGWNGCSDSTSAQITVAGRIDGVSCNALFASRVVVAGSSAPAGLTVIASSSASSPQAVCSGNQCTVDAGNTPITLTAAASTHDYEFSGWTGAGCSDQDSEPLVLRLASVSQSLNCTANYRVRITVALSGASGSVAVTTPGAGIRCTPGAGPFVTCWVNAGSAVTVNATDTESARFTAWNGPAGCPGSAVHALNISAPTTCTASFTQRWTIRYAREVPGGFVNSSPAASCVDTSGNNCTLIVDEGSNVDLTATVLADSGYRFGSWSCTDADTTTPSVLDLNNVAANYTCNATFIRQYRARGLVSGAPAGNSVSIAPCNTSDCTRDTGTNMTLTAPLVAGHNFSGWTSNLGSCSDANPDNNPRTLQFSPLTTDITCTANYVPVPRFTVRVARIPSDIGQAGIITPTTGNPVCTGIAGINSSCVVDAGTRVQLSGSSTDTAVFTGFSGPSTCSTGSVVVSSNLTCDASFYGLWSRSYATGFRVPAAARHDGLPRADALPRDDGRIVTTDTAAYPAANEYAGWFAPLDEHTGTAEGDKVYLVRDAAGAAYQTFAYGLARSPDGGTAIVGSRLQGTVHSPLLTLLDNDDNAILSQDYRGSDSSDYLTQIIWRNDRYFAAGHFESPLTAHVASFASSGKLMFTRSIAQPLACRGDRYPTRGRGIAATRDGVAVVSRVERSLNNGVAHSILLSILTPTGETLREVAISSGDANGARDLDPRGIFVTRDDGIVIVGATQESAEATSAQNAFMIFLKADLDPVWQFEIGVTRADDFLWDVIQAGDGSQDLILAGATSAIAGNTLDGWLLRVRADSDRPSIRAQHSYGGAMGEMLLDVESMPSGGYVLTGYRYDPNTRLRTYSMWATRVSDDLKIGFNAASGMSLGTPNTTLIPITLNVTPTLDNCFYNVPMQAGENRYTPEDQDPNLAEVGYAP